MANPKKPVESGHTLADDATLVKMVWECRKEAEQAKTGRIQQNKRNWDAYYGNQDMSDKQEGQSQESLPKIGEAVEQFAAFVKRALTQFGDWFSMEVPRNTPFTAEQARKLVRCYLDKVQVGPNKTQAFATILSVAIKAGLLEPLIVLKVHGRKVKQSVYRSEKGKSNPVAGDRAVWRLCIDLLPNGDYFPDPTGRGLYEIHRVERDLVDVQALATQGIYDKAVVDQIVTDYTRNDEGRMREVQKNQNETTTPGFRKRIVIDEFWGMALNPDGSLYMDNAVCAIANDKYVLRKLEPNPFWHGRSPFVAVPLVQVPYSVWGKALYDHAVSLNTALNELFNLMLDGGIAEVWGIRQVRTEWLDDPAQVSGGIPQGATLAVNASCPIDGKVVERIDSSGAAPQSALAMFNLADREFQSATMVNDIRMGSLPPRQVKATEVVESSNNSAVLLDSFASDVEHELIETVLSMVWMLLLQNMGALGGDEVADALGQANAFDLARMSPADRYEKFARGYGFKTFGLSATLSRARDFQKLMALMQAVGTNPMLMQAFMKKFSPDKTLDFIFKSLNINPDSLQNTPEEMGQIKQRMAEMMQLSQVTSGTQSPSPTGGSASTEGEIAQNVAPSGGPGA